MNAGFRRPFPTILLGTVLLERNRWGSRIPTIEPSAWWPRVSACGFDGYEIWEEHLIGNSDEMRLLAGCKIPCLFLNTYAPLDARHAARWSEIMTAARQLGVTGIKYNAGTDPNRLAEEKRALLEYADAMPEGCRMLCECHAGTALERPESAAEFHAGLDPRRFGVIVHAFQESPERLNAWFQKLGSRICHVHVQMRGATAHLIGLGKAPERARFAIEQLNHWGYDAGFSIEFTEGVNSADETPERLLAHAASDLEFLKREIIQ